MLKAVQYYLSYTMTMHQQHTHACHLIQKSLLLKHPALQDTSITSETKHRPKHLMMWQAFIHTSQYFKILYNTLVYIPCTKGQ
jgi:hypothetical protein